VTWKDLVSLDAHPWAAEVRSSLSWKMSHSRAE
jgi:hypothetical protein